MLRQEASTEPYYEEEVEETILPSLNWRAEGRARRPVLVRGGILADEVRSVLHIVEHGENFVCTNASPFGFPFLKVGYGKTALALGLVDAAPQFSVESPSRLLQTSATLIIVPPHLSGQWPAEVNKFLGEEKVVVQLETLSSLNSVSVKDLQDADIVIVNFTLLSNDKYFSRLANLCGVDASFVGSDSKGRRFENLYAACVHAIPDVVENVRQSCAKAHQFVRERAKENTDNADETLWIDSKKAAYKNTAATGKARGRVDCSEEDPWGLKSSRDYRSIKCPPLEMFFWNRVIVDEYVTAFNACLQRYMNLTFYLSGIQVYVLERHKELPRTASREAIEFQLPLVSLWDSSTPEL
jgi:SNF2-related domain